MKTEQTPEVHDVGSSALLGHPNCNGLWSWREDGDRPKRTRRSSTGSKRRPIACRVCERFCRPTLCWERGVEFRCMPYEYAALQAAFMLGHRVSGGTMIGLLSEMMWWD